MKNNILIASVLITLSICSILFFVYITPISTFFKEHHLLPEPERFTELYFEDHENLPKKIEPGKLYTFSFTVHNLEYKDMKYPYNVYLLLQGEKTSLQQGSIPLSQNQRKTIKVTVGTDISIQKAEIIVDLPQKHQDITFWVNNE